MVDRRKPKRRQRVAQPRRELLLADAKARQRGENRDGSRRRETVVLEAPVETVAAPPAPANLPARLSAAFDPATSTWFVEGVAELEAPTLAALRARLPAGVELVA